MNKNSLQKINKSIKKCLYKLVKRFSLETIKCSKYIDYEKSLDNSFLSLEKLVLFLYVYKMIQELFEVDLRVDRSRTIRTSAADRRCLFIGDLIEIVRHAVETLFEHEKRIALRQDHQQAVQSAHEILIVFDFQ